MTALQSHRQVHGKDGAAMKFPDRDGVERQIRLIKHGDPESKVLILFAWFNTYLGISRCEILKIWKTDKFMNQCPSCSSVSLVAPRMNCEDFHDVCAAQGIDAYPTLRLYKVCFRLILRNGIGGNVKIGNKRSGEALIA